MPINIQPIWQEKLTSPTCPFCRQEMSLTEHDVDQDGSTIIVWECDFCRALIEVNVYPPDDPMEDWEYEGRPIYINPESPRRGD